MGLLHGLLPVLPMPLLIPLLSLNTFRLLSVFHTAVLL